MLLLKRYHYFFFFFFKILKYGDNIFLGLFFEKEQNLSYSFNSLY